MLLSQNKSLCEPNQKIVVSKDKKTSREHRALNLSQQNTLRHYRLDGDIVIQETCCDYLLINDTLKNAYIIELKGGNIEDAIPQLENGAFKFRAELEGYELYFRIITSKVRIHAIQTNKFRKFKDKYGSHLTYKTNQLIEIL